MLWKAIIPQKGGELITEIQSMFSSWVELSGGGVIGRVVRRDGMSHRLIFWSRHVSLGVDILRNNNKKKENNKNSKNLIGF